MKPYQERKLFRWIHILFSIPIAGYIYGPVSQIPEAVSTIKWVFFPVILLSGFWMWLGPRLKRKFKTRYTEGRG